MYKHHELINYYTIRTLIYFLSKSEYIILFLKINYCKPSQNFKGNI